MRGRANTITGKLNPMARSNRQIFEDNDIDFSSDDDGELKNQEQVTDFKFHENPQNKGKAKEIVPEVKFLVLPEKQSKRNLLSTINVAQLASDRSMEPKGDESDGMGDIRYGDDLDDTSSFASGFQQNNTLQRDISYQNIDSSNQNTSENKFSEPQMSGSSPQAQIELDNFLLNDQEAFDNQFEAFAKQSVDRRHTYNFESLKRKKSHL